MSSPKPRSRSSRRLFHEISLTVLVVGIGGAPWLAGLAIASFADVHARAGALDAANCLGVLALAAALVAAATHWLWKL